MWQHGIAADPFAVCTQPAAGAGLQAFESPSWDPLAWDLTSGGLPAEDTIPIMPDFEIGTDFTQFVDFTPAAAIPHFSPSTASLGNDFTLYSSSGQSSPHTGVGIPVSPESASGSGSGMHRGPSGSGRAAAAKREAPEVILRRERNTIAARKYRQKKFDRIDELEKLLEAALQERDDLKLRLARQEAETDALKRVMEMGKGSKA